MVNLLLKDGSKLEFENGIKPMEVAKSISQSLAKVCVVAKLNGNLIGLKEELNDVSGEFVLITEKDPEAFEVLNHSTSHLLAHAVKRLYPNAKFGVGPAIEEGFYYDIYLEEKLEEKDLAKIEKEMKQIGRAHV